MSYCLALTTTSSTDEAKGIAATLVDEQLVACVTIVPQAISIYRWQGRREESTECLLVIKTTAERIEALKHRLPQLHSYDCPELVVIPITDGLPIYLQWMSDTMQTT